MDAGVANWNNAPGSFVITAALRSIKPPDHVMVPALSRVREVMVMNEGLLIVSATPGGIIVLPAPLIPPPVQLIAPPTVTF
jgi:hypothetical protein